MRDLLDHDVAEPRVGPEPAADADVHRLDELAVDLLEHALDADVGDLVLRAARRAAREVQAEVLAVAVRAHVLVEELGDLGRAVLRVDLGQAAELLAGAGLQAAREQRRARGESSCEQRLGEQRVDALVGDPRQQHVLLVGERGPRPRSPYSRASRTSSNSWSAVQAPDRDDRSRPCECSPSVCGVTPMWSWPRRSGRRRDAAAQRRGRAARSSSSRRPPGPIAVDEELQPRLPRFCAVLLGVAEDRR